MAAKVEEVVKKGDEEDVTVDAVLDDVTVDAILDDRHVGSLEGVNEPTRSDDEEE